MSKIGGWKKTNDSSFLVRWKKTVKPTYGMYVEVRRGGWAKPYSKKVKSGWFVNAGSDTKNVKRKYGFFTNKQDAIKRAVRLLKHEK